jgi:hypothetical protein
MATPSKVIVEINDRSSVGAHLVFAAVFIGIPFVDASMPRAFAWPSVGLGVTLLLIAIRPLILPRPAWRVVARGDRLEWGRGDDVDGGVNLAEVIGYHLDSECGSASFQVDIDRWVDLTNKSMGEVELRTIEKFLIEDRGMHDEKRGRPFGLPPGLFR